jgi:hypothetical protein
MFKKNNASTSLKKAAYRQGARGNWKWEHRNARTADETLAIVIDSKGREFKITSYELDWVGDLTWPEVKEM